MSSCALSTNSIGCPCDVTTIPPFGPFLGCAWARLAVAVMTISSANKPYFNILVLHLGSEELESFARSKRAGLRRREPLQWPFAESEEQHGREDGIQQGRAQQTAEDGDRDRVQDFPSRLIRAKQQRGQGEAGRKRRHQHRGQPLEAASDDNSSHEELAFVQGKIDILRNLQDAVSRRDAGERDEADHGGHRKRLRRDIQRNDAADQSQRNIAHDDQGENCGAIAAVEHQEDGRQRNERERTYAQGRLFLRLEGAFQTGRVSLRNLDIREDATDIRRDRGHVAATVTVAIHDDAAARALTLNLVGTVRFRDLGKHAERDVTRWRSNQEITQSCRRAVLVGEAYHNVEAAVAVDDLRYSSTIRKGVQRLCHRGWCQPVKRGAFIVHLYAQLRDEHLFFDLEIDYARHHRELLARGLGETTKRFQVVAENLQDDLRTHPRLQVIQPMADRLADGDRNGQRGKALANIDVDFRFRTCRAREVHIDLAEMNALGVLIEFGAAGAATDRLDLGHLRDQPLGHETQPVRLGQ